jgi:hypothetical protein
MQNKSNILLNTLDRILDLTLCGQSSLYLGPRFSELIETDTLHKSIGVSGNSGDYRTLFQKSFGGNSDAHILCTATYDKRQLAFRDTDAASIDTYKTLECVSTKEEFKQFFNALKPEGITYIRIQEIESNQLEIATFGSELSGPSFSIKIECTA